LVHTLSAALHYCYTCLETSKDSVIRVYKEIGGLYKCSSHVPAGHLQPLQWYYHKVCVDASWHRLSLGRLVANTSCCVVQTHHAACSRQQAGQQPFPSMYRACVHDVC
jgi:hypothetical protein